MIVRVGIEMLLLVMLGAVVEELRHGCDAWVVVERWTQTVGETGWE